MKKYSSVLILLLLLVVPAIQAKEPCSINTITGTYAFEITGSMFFGNPTNTNGIFAGPLVGMTLVGEFTTDASGNASGYYWMASGFVNSLDSTLPWNATFAVSPDCTGEIRYNALADGKPIVEKLVILENGNELRTIVHGIASPSMTGTVWETTAWRIARPLQALPWCAPNAFVGEWVIRCSGWDIAPNGMMLPSMMLTKAEVRPGGAFDGKAFLTVGPGTVSDVPVSGTFTLNPNCTAGSVMSLGQLGTVIAKGVFYNNGKDAVGMPMYHQEDPVNHHSVGNQCVFTRVNK